MCKMYWYANFVLYYVLIRNSNVIYRFKGYFLSLHYIISLILLFLSFSMFFFPICRIHFFVVNYFAPFVLVRHVNMFVSMLCCLNDADLPIFLKCYLCLIFLGGIFFMTLLNSEFSWKYVWYHDIFVNKSKKDNVRPYPVFLI